MEKELKLIKRHSCALLYFRKQKINIIFKPQI